MSKSWRTIYCEEHTYMWTEATSYCRYFIGRTAGTVVRDGLLLPARGDGHVRRNFMPYYSRTCISLHDNLSRKISPQMYNFCACIPCNSNLSVKTGTPADCSWYVIVATFPARLLLCLNFVFYGFVGKIMWIIWRSHETRTSHDGMPCCGPDNGKTAPTYEDI